MLKGEDLETTKKCTESRSQPSATLKLPEMLNKIIAFLKQHDFVAQTVEEIRIHLYERVVYLESHEDSLATIHCFFF